MADLVLFQNLRKRIIDDEFSSLNDQQRAAVYHSDSTLLILAGAGSGKTTVLVNKIRYLLKYGNTYNCTETYKDIDDSDIEFLSDCVDNPQLRVGNRYEYLMNEGRLFPSALLGITFTNKAAAELRERIAKDPAVDVDGLWAFTFHSTAMRILRVYADLLGYTKDFSVYDDNDTKKLIENIIKEGNFGDEYKAKSVMAVISQAKCDYVSPEEYAGEYSRYDLPRIGEIYAKYNSELKKSNAMDFDDLIFNGVRLLSSFPEVAAKIQGRFKYVLVDEFQDTNLLQNRFVGLLSAGGKLCVVGDDDQSIYRFMGATPDNILKFDKQYKDTVTVRLEKNYRSTETILNAANEVISNNKARKGKVLWSENGKGDKIRYRRLQSQIEEGQYISEIINRGVFIDKKKYCDYAVLYRTHAQSNSIETALRANGIPYRVYGGLSFYKRKEVQDVLAYFGLINNHSDEIRLQRIINEPKRGIGAQTLENIRAIALDSGMSSFDVLKEAGNYPSLSRAAAKLVAFAEIIEKYTRISKDTPISEWFYDLYDEIGYDRMLRDEYDKNEYESKRQNVMELMSSVKQYEADAEDPSLSEYLSQVSLVSATDSLDDENNAVVLMTVHCAKGLEFDTVFISGFEEGIFPSFLSFESASGVEEERRLCYVAITRAKKKLYITSVCSRMLYGMTKENIPSRFLNEIPSDLIDREETAKRQTYGESSAVRETDFAKPVSSRPSSFGSSSGTVFSMPSADKNISAVKYDPGMRVHHKIFGDGTVTEAVNMSSDSMLTVNFDGVGTKKLMAKFAKLEIIS